MELVSQSVSQLTTETAGRLEPEVLKGLLMAKLGPQKETADRHPPLQSKAVQTTAREPTWP
jgi:hypothetical protein